MASCAACLEPILRSQQFVLDGTEVFHRACAGQAYRSRLRIAEQRVRELEAQVADTRRAAARVEADTNRLRNEVTSKGAEVIQMVGTLSEARALLISARERLQATEGALQSAYNENAALRAELAAFKPEASKAQEDVDATVQRFRMLELD